MSIVTANRKNASKENTNANPNSEEQNIEVETNQAIGHAAMTDKEIKQRRAELEKRIEEVSMDWKLYDNVHPVRVGELIPDNYYHRQRQFSDALSELHNELQALPRTKARKMTIGAILIVVAGIVWWVWRVLL